MQMRPRGHAGSAGGARAASRAPGWAPDGRVKADRLLRAAASLAFEGPPKPGQGHLRAEWASAAPSTRSRDVSVWPSRQRPGGINNVQRALRPDWKGADGSQLCGDWPTTRCSRPFPGPSAAGRGGGPGGAGALLQEGRWASRLSDSFLLSCPIVRAVLGGLYMRPLWDPSCVKSFRAVLWVKVTKGRPGSLFSRCLACPSAQCLGGGGGDRMDGGPSVTAAGQPSSVCTRGLPTVLPLSVQPTACSHCPSYSTSSQLSAPRAGLCVQATSGC